MSWSGEVLTWCEVCESYRTVSFRDEAHFREDYFGECDLCGFKHQPLSRCDDGVMHVWQEEAL